MKYYKMKLKNLTGTRTCFVLIPAKNPKIAWEYTDDNYAKENKTGEPWCIVDITRVK